MSSTTPEARSQLDNDYKTVNDFLGTRSGVFQELIKVQELVWESPEADKYFEIQKNRVTTLSEKRKTGLYELMKKIGDSIQAKQRIIPPPFKKINLKALDICMAPGGYSATVLKHNYRAKICALSLPIDEGGHDIFLPN